MSMGRFHTICDKCGSRGAEYCAHTIACRECGDDVCAGCAQIYDADPPGNALCKACAQDAPVLAAAPVER